MEFGFRFFFFCYIPYHIFEHDVFSTSIFSTCLDGLMRRIFRFIFLVFHNLLSWGASFSTVWSVLGVFFLPFYIISHCIFSLFIPISYELVWFGSWGFFLDKFCERRLTKAYIS